jgi:small subunit ribosomal protein S7
MPRGGQIKKRAVSPDPRFNSIVAAKLINQVMRGGEKEVARLAVYHALVRAGKTLETEPLLVLAQAVTNVTPTLEVRSRRVGGATYQIPIPVEAARGQALAIRWLIDVSRAKTGKPFEERLGEELVAAYNGEGAAVKKKEEMHRIAEANRAFAHFRW